MKKRLFLSTILILVSGCATKSFDTSLLDEKKVQVNRESTIDGTTKFSDGSVYTGTLKNNVPEGKGVLLFSTGSRYEGQFKQGLMDGRGIFYDKTGEVIEGEFSRDEPKKGVFKFVDGRIFDGIFSKWLPLKGEIKDLNGSVYKGAFVNSLLQGDGIKTLVGGEQYKGSFSKGLFHGEIIYSPLSIEKNDYFQVWRNGQKTFETLGPRTIEKLKLSPKCKLKGQAQKIVAWLYVSGGCQGGWVDGKAKITSSDMHQVIEGTFDRGRLISGIKNSRNGIKINGQWKGFLPNGQAKYYEGSVLKYDGQFVLGQRHGYGLCEYSGRLERCEYYQDKRIDQLSVMRQMELKRKKEAYRAEKQAEKEREYERDRQHREKVNSLEKMKRDCRRTGGSVKGRWNNLRCEYDDNNGPLMGQAIMQALDGVQQQTQQTYGGLEREIDNINRLMRQQMHQNSFEEQQRRDSEQVEQETNRRVRQREETQRKKEYEHQQKLAREQAKRYQERREALAQQKEADDEKKRQREAQRPPNTRIVSERTFVAVTGKEQCAHLAELSVKNQSSRYCSGYKYKLSAEHTNQIKQSFGENEFRCIHEADVACY